MDEVQAATSAESAARERSEGRPRESLALLYQGFLTGIVRLQAKRQELGQPASFRQRMRVALKDVQRDAVAMGYSPEDVKDAEFAIVAFLDEVILGCDDPGRDEWAKQTLSAELFREAHAGEVFFERLHSFGSRRDSLQLADLLEVYLLCLLLGFQGRYVSMPGELQAVVDRTFRRIQGIRPVTSTLFPEAQVNRPNSQVAVAIPPGERWRMKLVWMLAGGLLIFLLCWLTLGMSISGLSEVAGGAS